MTETLTMSVLVFAGSSQFAALSLIAQLGVFTDAE
ncbi:MAG: AzlC family ABC transporter permease [Firmicutes bacterium]|nr:AzlC family ABC transporter permease [Bacillota bacterium]